MSGLVEFEFRVVQLFFEVAASHGFVVAGRAALVATSMADQLRHEIEFLGSSGEVDLDGAAKQFVSHVLNSGWFANVLEQSSTRVHLQVMGADIITVDLVAGTPPVRPTVNTGFGPTLDPREAAGRQLLAFVENPTPERFEEVYRLSLGFGQDAMFSEAVAVDPSLAPSTLADMIDSLDGISDAELPCNRYQSELLRAAFAGWADELRSI
jgi:hypothetical protein